MIKRFSLALAATVFFVPSAWAEPLSIGSIIGMGLFNATGIGITSAAALSAIGSIAIGAAVVGLQMGVSALTRPKGPEPQQFKSNIPGAGEASEVRAIGRVRTGGPANFRDTKGFNTFRSILHCRGPISGFEQFYIGGREVILSGGTGEVDSPPWRKGTDRYAVWKYHTGESGTGAWADLVSAFPGRWTVDHRAKGIAQSLVKLISPGTSDPYYLELYGSNVREDLQVILRGELVYDPRDDSVKFSENGILAAAHLLRADGAFPLGDVWWEKIAEQADRADALVATKSGMEPRATAAGLWASEQGRLQPLTDCLRSIGGEIVINPDDGRVGIVLVDDDPVSEVTIAVDDIVDEQEAFGPDAVSRPNTVRLRYYNRERDYRMEEIPLLKDDGITPLDWSVYPDEIAIVGRQVMDIDLPFCTSAAQAQRVARRLFELERSRKGVVRTNFAGMLAWGARCVSIQFDEMGADGGIETVKCLTAEMSVDDEAGICEIPFVVHPALQAWLPSRDEATPLPPIPPFEYASELDAPDAPSAATLVRYLDGSHEYRLAIAPTTGGSAYPSGVTIETADAVIRQFPGGLPDPFIVMAEEGLTLALRATGNISGQRVESKVRYIDSDDNVSPFSAVLADDPVTIDNSAPPQLVNDSLDFAQNGNREAVISGFALNAAYLTATLDGVETHRVDGVRPGMTVTLELLSATGPTPANDNVYSIYQHSTDGTSSPALIITIVAIP